MHILQSPEWESFKNKYSTKAIRAGGVLYTKHKIPLIPYYVAYSAKVNPFEINFESLKNSLKENSCIAINFDCPDILKTDSNVNEASKILSSKCVKSARNVFAKNTIIVDLSKSEDEIFKNAHVKHRYNIRLAEKKGVEVKKEPYEGFETFFKLYEETAKREKYYTHPKSYYKLIWDLFYPLGIAHILTAYYNNQPLASWMLFSYDNILYYPYGGTSIKNRELMGGTLLGWNAIKLGKQLGCTKFDMWGTLPNLDDKSNPWWGFTQFKVRYGGTIVEFIDSYDLVLNKPLYYLFNLGNNIRWKILRLIKSLSLI